MLVAEKLYYADVSNIRRELKRIADSLELMEKRVNGKCGSFCKKDEMEFDEYGNCCGLNEKEICNECKKEVGSCGCDNLDCVINKGRGGIIKDNCNECKVREVEVCKGCLALDKEFGGKNGN
jgi:hypothetical protein